MENIHISINNDTIKLSGKITFENIVKLLSICTEKIKQFETTYIDLKDIINSDSVVLLFIINCIKYARKNKKIIEFSNISKLTLEFSKVYNLDTIITEQTKKA